MNKAVLVTQLYPTLCYPMDVVHQAPLSMKFSRQEYWSINQNHSIHFNRITQKVFRKDKLSSNWILLLLYNL